MKLLWAFLFVLPLVTATAACLHYGPPNVTLTAISSAGICKLRLGITLSTTATAITIGP
jgi:hypothetical protein